MGRGTSHTFSEIFFHLNWHCKDDEPLIQPEIEPKLYETIDEYCRKVKGVHFKKIGGTCDHVHLVFQMEPFVPLSDFIGKVKGYSSHAINEIYGKGTIKWQRGYGIVSFSRTHLPTLIRYVEDQKKHHQEGTTNRTLEIYRIDIEDQED